MSNLAVRLNMLVQPVVRFARKRCEVMFSRKYLLLTNTGIALTLGSTGDIIQQRYEILCRRQSHWDLQRTKKIMVTNLFIGPACHYWYIFLDIFFPGRKVGIIMKKILVDMIIFSPVNISLFLVVMGIQEGLKSEEIVKDLRQKGSDLLLAEWIVWPPAQVINFFFLPTKFRVLYDNTISLGFDCYYSYVMFKKGKEGAMDTEPEKGDIGSEDNCKSNEDNQKKD